MLTYSSLDFAAIRYILNDIELVNGVYNNIVGS